MNSINNFWGSECIILTRVSTQKQDFEAQNLDLTTYAKELGFTNITIIATKESGFKIYDNKEGFGLVLEHLKDNPACKTILVTELSRVGRNRKVITDIEYYLRNNKINLIIKDTKLSLFDNNGNITQGSEFMFPIYATMAESEMKQKKERFSRAKRKFFSEGISITGTVLFGYNRVLNPEINRNVYQINPEKAEQIKTIFQWYISGIDGDTSKSSVSLITLECIKKGFDNYLHSKRNVNKCLKEEAYTGQKTTNNKMKNPEFWEYGNKTATRYINADNYVIKYPVILSNEVFKSVQMKLKERNSATDKSKHTTILSKMLVCPECNHYYRGEYMIKQGDIKHFYRCSHSKAIVKPCINKSTLSMLQLDSVIWSFVKQNVSELVDNVNNSLLAIDITEIKQQIENLKNKILEYENDKDTETVIFRSSIRKTTNRDLTIDNYEQKINSIDLKIEQIENLINERIELINDIELNQKEDKQDIKNKIIDIENNKAELKKYIRLLIKKIIPIYSDRSYTVINLKSIENLGSSLNLGGNWSNGIPEMKSNVSEIDYFVIINKKDNHRIKVKYIENNNNVIFENNCFVYNSHVSTIEKIMNSRIGDIMEEPYISLSKESRNEIESNMINFITKDLDYIRFSNDLYLEDIKQK